MSENRTNHNPDAKNAIADMYLQLIHQKQADKITVRELTEKCNVTRQAFYYHYPDIKGVMEYVIQREITQIGKECMDIQGDYPSFRHMFQRLFQFGPSIRKMMDSSFRPQAEQTFISSIRSILPDISEVHTPDIQIRNADRKLILDFSSLGLAGYVIEHCMDPDTDSERTCNTLYHLIVQYRSAHNSQ